MKSLLARGGVEFIAVLLGISLSLYVDENSKKKEIQLALQKDLISIRADLKKIFTKFKELIV